MDNTIVENEGIPLSLPYRIFLASPGDVQHERSIVSEVVAELRGNARYRNALNVQLIAWDEPGVEIPLSAGLTPQESIARGMPKPSACDLVICIFWSRIGTPLPAEIVKPNGECYLSGTEWEYWDAMDAYRRDGRPEMLLYRRERAPMLSPDDPKFDEKTEQWRRLQGFLAKSRNPDGSLIGGSHAYSGPEVFREKVRRAIEHHLDIAVKVFEERVPEEQRTLQRMPVVWRGNPYPGAEAFGPDRQQVFFGRDAEIDRLLERLARPASRVVIVTGASGSGKSSLVLGGLVPRLRAGVITTDAWIDVIFKPAQRENDPFSSLAAALQKMSPADAAPHASIDKLPEKLEQSPELLLDTVKQSIETKGTSVEIALVIDQFEELFTLVDRERGDCFLAWLHRFLEYPSTHVIATMRSDFYAAASERPLMAEFLRRDALFAIDPPGAEAMREIIKKPALAAGVRFEDGLVERMMEDAGRQSGALALTAFALHELYEQGHKDGLLSIHEYEQMGGISGAVRNKVDSLLRHLPGISPESLDQLFTQLVKFGDENKPTRKRVRKEEIADQALVDALAGARLLVVEQIDEAMMVEIAHEALFDAWPELAEWIKGSEEQLAAQRDLEQIAQEWERNGKPSNGLRGGALLARYRTVKRVAGPAAAYLKACSRRMWWRRSLAALGVVLAGVGFWLFIHVQGSDYPPAFAVKGLAVRLGVMSVDVPEMVTIPAGRFLMGDLGDDCRAPDRPPTESLCQVICGPSELPGSCLPNEHPDHSVSIARPFMLAKYEVSFAEYDLFAAATGRRKPNDMQFGESAGGRAKLPVIDVSWTDAEAYTHWLSKKTGELYRLPTEAEWEYAARAGTSVARFWESGDRPFATACQYANVFDQGHSSETTQRFNSLKQWSDFPCTDHHAYTAPVDHAGYQANPWGLHQILGNVSEWVADCYQSTYQGVAADGSAHRAEKGRSCVRFARGGNWLNNPIAVRAAFRSEENDYADMGVGFRVAKELSTQPR